jgi:uncharacterized membrane protein YfcA
LLAVLFAVAVWAGIQNALAGGGSFVTLPVLMWSGLDARTANIASTLALFPGQLTTGWVGRKEVRGTPTLGFRALTALSVVGGAVGAVLLLLTPVTVFEHMVAWLVLIATALFTYGSFFQRRSSGPPRLGLIGAGTAQFLIAIYGGYFGGGIGILMLAALTLAGLAMQAAGATKNVLAGVMNAAAVVIFLFTPDIPWLRVAAVAVGSMLGGYFGAILLKRVNDRIIRIVVIVLGLSLTIGLFLKNGL